MSSNKTRALDDHGPVQVEAQARLPAPLVYQIIKQEGQFELDRPLGSLWWSGIAAGFGISASPVVEGLLYRYAPDRPLLESLGYCSGFLIVILGRLQLFTENTITAVLPLFAHFRLSALLRVARLWSIVLLANLVGTFGAMLLLAKAGGVAPETLTGMLEVSRGLANLTAGEAFAHGVPAGFLIAAIVWLMPSSRGSEFWVVIALTYIIALGGFTHVIAGSAEIFLLVISGELSLMAGIFELLMPVLFGNILGGTALFAALAYGQVHAEVQQED